MEGTLPEDSLVNASETPENTEATSMDTTKPSQRIRNEIAASLKGIVDTFTPIQARLETVQHLTLEEKMDLDKKVVEASATIDRLKKLHDEMEMAHMNESIDDLETMCDKDPTCPLNASIRRIAKSSRSILDTYDRLGKV